MTRYTSAVVVPTRPERQFHIWIPLLLAWLLLLPFVLLLVPLVFLVCLVFGTDPVEGVAAFWQLFSALRGLRVEVEDPRARIRIV